MNFKYLRWKIKISFMKIHEIFEIKIFSKNFRKGYSWFVDKDTLNGTIHQKWSNDQKWWLMRKIIQSGSKIAKKCWIQGSAEIHFFHISFLTFFLDFYIDRFKLWNIWEIMINRWFIGSDCRMINRGIQ